PVSELYYESLKYLRKMSPTPEYVKDVTAKMKDDFPVITTWDDPIQYSCQKNFIITIGDSSTWCDSLLPGNSLAPGGDCTGHRGVPSAPDRDINVTNLTNRVGQLERMGNLGRQFLKPSQSATYYIAGLAYWANTNDIRPDVARVPQTNGKQTVQSFFVD